MSQHQKKSDPQCHRPDRHERPRRPGRSPKASPIAPFFLRNCFSLRYALIIGFSPACR